MAMNPVLLDTNAYAAFKRGNAVPSLSCVLLKPSALAPTRQQLADFCLE
jgi:hypothetical protein